MKKFNTILMLHATMPHWSAKRKNPAEKITIAEKVNVKRTQTALMTGNSAQVKESAWISVKD